MKETEERTGFIHQNSKVWSEPTDGCLIRTSLNPTKLCGRNPLILIQICLWRLCGLEANSVAEENKPFCHAGLIWEKNEIFVHHAQRSSAQPLHHSRPPPFYLSIHLSVHPSTFISIHLSFYSSICISFISLYIVHLFWDSWSSCSVFQGSKNYFKVFEAAFLQQTDLLLSSTKKKSKLFLEFWRAPEEVPVPSWQTEVVIKQGSSQIR